MVRHISIREALVLVAWKDMFLEQMDVKTVFLHGNLEEQIYVEHPEVFVVIEQGLVWKLKRSLDFSSSLGFSLVAMSLWGPVGELKDLIEIFFPMMRLLGSICLKWWVLCRGWDELGQVLSFHIHCVMSFSSYVVVLCCYSL